eukprot:gene51336-68713_t
MAPIRGMSNLVSSSTTRPVLALDFDGVICASSRESSVSAVVAVESFWPHIRLDTSERSLLNGAIMSLRPVIETGYENMLVCRLLAEQYKKSGSIDTSTIMEKWGAKYRDDAISSYGTSK